MLDEAFDQLKLGCVLRFIFPRMVVEITKGQRGLPAIMDQLCARNRGAFEVSTEVVNGGCRVLSLSGEMNMTESLSLCVDEALELIEITTVALSPFDAKGGVFR